MPFSCRERVADHLQKPTDLAREAVSCNGGLGHRFGAGDSIGSRLVNCGDIA
jgi:hypothetical protein